jgi:muramoyltetrapeptide carboxypeptidase
MTITMDALGPLRTADRVALVATSGPVDGDRLDQSLALLEGWGLTPVVYPTGRSAHPTLPYLAATDARRAADLQEAWCDEGIDAVFCMRGGYGSVRLLDLLDVEALRSAQPKPLFGSSDVTGVHEFWNERLGVPTWFTPMLATGALLDDAAATDSLRRAVFEPAAGRVFTSADAVGLVPGSATGELIGGNLSLLAMTLGARGRPDVDHTGRIALLEDVGEEPYRIDGLLMKLLRAGWFEGVAGIALGSWLDCGDPAEIRAVVDELLVPLGVPLVWQLGFGHDTAAPSIPLGVRATLSAGPSPSLTIAGDI